MSLLIYSLLTSVVFLLIYYVYSIQFWTRKLPPGPYMSPFGLGIVPSVLLNQPKLWKLMVSRQWEYFHQIRKRYGDIFSVEAGSIYAVVICSYELMNEVANMEEYSDKFAHKTMTYPRTFNKELGLIFVAKPEIWVEMRKFTQRTLRNFGFGKRHTMQSAIEAETSVLVKDFKEAINSNGGIIQIRTTFVLSVLNVLWCMVAGQRYERDDPILVKMMERNFEMIKSSTFTDVKGTFLYLKQLLPSLFGEELKLQCYNDCHKFTQGLIDQRKVDDTHLQNPQSYIDVFLQKINENKGNAESIYSEEQLQAMLVDLLQTGTTTTNGTLNYALLYLILNPEIQRKCQKEIDATVPRHLTPTIEDIEKMQYFQAFILETHRHANIVPIPIPRLVPKDWNIRGYTIPKGSVVVTNHYSVHMDKEYWGDPEVFRPERFINEEGMFVPDKRVVHFGFGKRICIGITLANSVIPIFLAALLQQFKFSAVPGQPFPTTEPEVGFSLSPVEFPLLLTNRVITKQSQHG